MKVFNDENTGFKYWCNATGDLFRPGKNEDIKEADLPKPLADVYKRLWSEAAYGSYCYIGELDGEYGIALTCEYYEYADGSNGVKREINNFDHAVEVGEMLEKRFPQYTVFIGKGIGFPCSYLDGTEEKATELTIFMKADVSKEDFTEVGNFLYENAYLQYSEEDKT